jgi:outer membrane lipoprotein-sorting protein
MTKTNNQDGIAHLSLILVLLLAIGVIGLTGWKVASKNKAGSDNTQTNNAVVSNTALEKQCNDQLHNKDLCKFASNESQLDKVAFTATVTGSGSDGESVTIWSSDGHGNTTTVVTQSGKEVTSMIYLNNTSYIKDYTDGSWTRYKTSNSATPKESNPTDEIKVDSSDLTEKNTISYKSLGQEACGKLTCFKYQVTDTTQPSTTTFLWFDNGDYLLRRWQVNDGKNTSDMTMTYQAVAIKEPSPVHDFTGVSVPTNTVQPDEEQ